MIDTIAFILIWLGGLLVAILAMVFVCVFIFHVAEIVDGLFRDWRRRK